jgi:hypothetical protein
MVTVKVEPMANGWSCRVAIDRERDHTEHVVTVTPADLERWGGGTAMNDVEELVKRSFDFLLEREQPSSILRTFELSAILRYFPEYDRTMRQAKQ